MGICGIYKNGEKNIEKMLSGFTPSDICDSCLKNDIAFGCSGNNSSIFSTTILGFNYSICFMGRLFNYDTISKQLLQLGYSLKAQSYSQAILTLYLHYKEKCVDMLIGNFCFVIYDEFEKNIFCARDKIGSFPIYYHSQHQQFVFASKISSLLTIDTIPRAIGKNEVYEIFGLGPAHTPGKTFFRDIFELRPGHYLIYSLKTNSIILKQYFEYIPNTLDKNTEIYCKEISSMLNKAVSYAINQTNKSCCTMLSGGLDSSILTCILSKEIPNINSYSLEYKNNTNDFIANDYQPTKDSDYVSIVSNAFNTKHKTIYVDSNDLLNYLYDTMCAKDMPGMADIDSSLYSFLKQIKKDGFSSVISGECSDEIFGGYPWYYNPKFISSTTFPWAQSIETRSNLLNKQLNKNNELEEYINKAYNNTLEKLVRLPFDDEYENYYLKTCYLTLNWFMPTLLDRTTSIATALDMDVFVPFAFSLLFEYVYSIPAREKLGMINNHPPIEKFLLRKTFKDDLPKEIINRKKSPFPKTYNPEYTTMLEKEIEEMIRDSKNPILELLDISYLLELTKEHGKKFASNWFGQLMSYPQTLAYLLQVNMWLKEYNISIEIDYEKS